MDMLSAWPPRMVTGAGHLGDVGISITTGAAMTHLDRFLAVMEYRPVDRVINWEVGVWPETQKRWAKEGLDPLSLPQRCRNQPV